MKKRNESKPATGGRSSALPIRKRQPKNNKDNRKAKPAKAIRRGLKVPHH